VSPQLAQSAARKISESIFFFLGLSASCEVAKQMKTMRFLVQVEEGEESAFFDSVQAPGITIVDVIQDENEEGSAFRPPTHSEALALSHLERVVQDKQEQIINLERDLSAAMENLRAFHRQQNELFQEFVALRNSYDKLKARMRSVLWEFLPRKIDVLSNIPVVGKEIFEDENRVGPWHIGETLGEGQFAVVKEVVGGPEELINGVGASNLAMKRIVKDRISDVRNLKRVNNEIKILRELSHENIVDLIDICHSENYLYIVQERGGLDLFEHYRRHPGPATEEFAKVVCGQLASAVDYLQHNQVAHRDIKPENILVDTSGSVKLVDFGLSCFHTENLTLDDFCGTPGFFGPEMLLQKEYSSQYLDLWSVGCVLLEMLLGHQRFDEIFMPAYAYEKLHDTREFSLELHKCLGVVQTVFETKGIEEEFEESKENPDFSQHKNQYSCERAQFEQQGRSDECKSFLVELLRVNPTERICSERLLTHPFLSMPGNEPKNDRNSLSVETMKRNANMIPLTLDRSKFLPASPKVDEVQELVNIGNNLLSITPH